MVVTNAFSINMLDHSMNISFTQIPLTMARRLMANGGFESAIGHESTAAVVSSLLEMHVPTNRTTVTFDGTVMLVAQYKGPRLPEGATSLPEGATIEWWLVEYLPPYAL
jgi:hypothetical protein